MNFHGSLKLPQGINNQSQKGYKIDDSVAIPPSGSLQASGCKTGFFVSYAVQHPVHVLRFTHKTTPVHVGKYTITKKSPSMKIV
jgi:hypothetical protein